jgi:hypothetical protein
MAWWPRETRLDLVFFSDGHATLLQSYKTTCGNLGLRLCALL